MKNSGNKLRRKKQAEEIVQKKRLEQESREREELARQRLDLFQSLDPMVTHVLNILGIKTWGSHSYTIKREVPSSWKIFHRRGYFTAKKSSDGYYYKNAEKTAGEKFVSIVEDEGYEISLVGQSQFEVNWHNHLVPISQDALEEALLKERPKIWRFDGQYEVTRFLKVLKNAPIN